MTEKEKNYDRLGNLNNSSRNSKEVEKLLENDITKTIVDCMKAIGTYDNAFVLSIGILDGLLTDYRDARSQWEAEGRLLVIEYTNKNGQTNTVKNPLYQSMEKLRMDILTYLRELGITPSGLKKLKQDSFGDETKVSKVEEMLISLSQM
ncbi:P27 family phage terminase small subunit [Anaerococcus murdochii]|uniref:P27 family phage terminase small subunit n=1 Tax=Anaerococcus murdochii TaxID=411577 RepID=A0ABS7SYU3_9FIRM|nr:P27 family phage terminase small subunit [Anaerococcus murdochii]MBZ2386676.1 P27 family phage terminase small subunit [Anaerococcus murdochii]